MRWWSFMLLAALVLTLQSAIAPRLALFGVRADWILVVVVFFALHARRRDAVIAGWALGLCADLMSIERVGLLALSYALAAWFVGWFRDYLFRREALTQFVVTFVAGFAVQTVWFVYRSISYRPGSSWSLELAASLVGAPLYTAIWAPAVHRILLGAGPWLGLPKAGYGSGGFSRLGGARV